MSVRHGDLVRMSSFTHVPAEGPMTSLTMKVGDRKKVAVFMLLGEENKDGTEPLDAKKRLHELGWIEDPALSLIRPQSDPPAQKGHPMSEETELQGCEHCDNEFDIEHMIMSGDVWLCPSCAIEWDKTFDACRHEWEDGDLDGERGKFCPKCSGFVESHDFKIMFSDVAAPSSSQETESHD